jgi:hypothetical protein
MLTAVAEADIDTVARDFVFLTRAHRRTLEAIFRHPTAHNLEWRDVVALIETIGRAQELTDGEFVFEVAGKRHPMRRPYGKDLTEPEVLALRHFLMHAHVSGPSSSQPEASV